MSLRVNFISKVKKLSFVSRSESESEQGDTVNEIRRETGVIYPWSD